MYSVWSCFISFCSLCQKVIPSVTANRLRSSVSFAAAGHLQDCLRCPIAQSLRHWPCLLCRWLSEFLHLCHQPLGPPFNLYLHSLPLLYFQSHPTATISCCLATVSPDITPPHAVSHLFPIAPSVQDVIHLCASSSTFTSHTIFLPLLEVHVHHSHFYPITI